MSLLSRLFGSSEPAQYHEHEQAVIVHFSYGSTNLQFVYAMEDQLRFGIADAKVGEYDSKEVADDGSDGYFYMYGPDADALYRVVGPILASMGFSRTATVTLRYGPAKRGTPKRIIELSR